jgi:hypothetical protein
MAHLFTLLETSEDIKSFDTPAKIVKNVTQGPFMVDEDGTQLHSLGVAAVDSDCEICNAAIESGKLELIKTVGQSSKSVKTKSKDDTAEMVVDVSEVQETVAPTSK